MVFGNPSKRNPSNAWMFSASVPASVCKLHMSCAERSSRSNGLQTILDGGKN